MKHNRFLSLALIGSVMLLAAACVEEIPSNEELYRPIGTPIVFSATTSYSNTPETRAEYSGDFFNGDTPSSTVAAIERIYWESGDKIRIVHNGTTAANYTVASGTNNTGERNSVATLTQGDLLWDGAESHTFYGLYPCVGTSVTSTTGGLTNNGTVSGTIPAAQDINPSNTLSVTEGGVTYSKYRPDTDKYGYMAAYKQVPANSGETDVVLPFRPAFTCFEFKLQRTGTENPAITSFELKTVEVNGSTTPLTGDFSLQINGGDTYGATWNTPTITNGGTSITVGGFGAGGVHVPTTGYLDFSVLALPINLTGVELVIHYASTETKTLKFMTSGTWKTFTGAKKYIITNVNVPDADYIYIVEEIPDVTTYGHEAQLDLSFNVKSYRYNSLIGISSKEAVPWKLQYAVQNGTTWSSWYDVANDGTTGSGSQHTVTNDTHPSDPIVTGTGVSTSTYSTGEPREANITGQSTSGTSSTNTVPAIRADLRTRTPRGTEQNPWDLSKHDIFGNSQNMTTANSYVVDRPGWYMFPCVYGNAINNAQVNWEAFRPGDPNVSSISNIYSTYETNGNVRYYYEFFDAANAPISHPYIKNNYTGNGGTCTLSGADIVWQNSMTGEAILTTNPSTTSIDPGAPNLGSVTYIKFQIKPEDIQPGNIVIAIKGSVQGLDNATNWYSDLPAGTILWSWQIWVTQADLTPITAGTESFMPRNLGAVDKTDAAVTQWADRRIKYRVVQVDNYGNERTIGLHTGDDEDFIVEEIGDAQTIAANIGNNPFYQWGRKDPMVPVDPLGVPVETGPGHNDGHVTDNVIPGTGYSDFDTAIGVDKITKTVNGVAVSYNNVMPGIQNPHRLCRNIYPQDNTYPTWIGGPDYAGGPVVGGYNYTRRGCLPYNLWNSRVYMNKDYGGNNKWKTIYDPCPPGFCVPNLNAVSTFNSASSRTNDGATVAGLFFPYTGLRAYHPGSIDTQMIGASGYIWVDVPHDGDDGLPDYSIAHHFARGFVVSRDDVYNPVTLGFHRGDVSYTRGSAFSIRPMVDPKAPVASSPSQSAAPNGNINSFNNGGELPE